MYNTTENNSTNTMKEENSHCGRHVNITEMSRIMLILTILLFIIETLANW